MKTSLRYKIVLWMVWVQLALLPVIIYMNQLEVYPEVWRWNISNWIPITGYVIGLLVLPMSRNLAISPILKLWLIIDFVLALLFLLPFSIYMYNSDWITERATSGKYVLFQRKGFLLHSETLHLGQKNGPFLRPLSKYVGDYPWRQKIDKFEVDTAAGCFYGYGCGEASVAWVLPLDLTIYHPDTIRYQNNAYKIDRLIDSIYASLPMGDDNYCGTFVFSDNFAKLSYRGKELFYKDSIIYHIEYNRQLVMVSRWNDDKFPKLRFPKDSVPYMSPFEVRKFVTNLKKEKGL